MSLEDEAIEKLDKTVNETVDDQQPAVDMEESAWADAPELTEAQERALAAAAKESSQSTEFDDTNHGDGEDQAPQVQATKRRAPEVEQEQEQEEDTPADEEIPAGKAAAPKAEGGEELPEFDPELIHAAGLQNEEEARIQFGTPTALKNAVRLMDQRSVQIADEALRAHALAQAQQQQLQQQQTSNNPAAKAPEFKMPEPPEGEEWDEATVALVTSLNAQFNAQLEAQRKIIEQQQRATQELVEDRRGIELRRYVDEFDGFVDDLGQEWKPLLGEGSGFSLKQDSLALKNRVHLDTVAKQLAFGRSQQGLPQLSQKDLLKRALSVAFPQQQEKSVRKQVEKEVKSRKEMITTRPTGRRGGKPKSGEESAAAYAERWYSERGMGNMPADEFEYDSI